jgi:sugar phosphate permease
VRYRWVVLAAGTFAQSTYSAIWFGVAVLAPALRDRYGLSLGQTGFLISASLLGSVLTLVPWGMAADRFGERAVLVSGVTVCGAALFAAAGARSFAALAAALFATGVAGASVHSSSGRAVMSWFPASQRGLALGIRQTAIPIGGFAVSVGIPPLEHRHGIGWGFGALGLACIVAAAVAAVVLRHAEPLEDEPQPGPPPLRDRRVWSLAAGSALVVAPQMCVVGFAVLFLHERRHLSPGSAAAVLAAIQLCGIGARIGAGRWSDVVGGRIAPLRTIALTTASFTVVTAVLVGAPLWLLVPSLVCTGILAMSWNGLAFAAAAELSGRSRAGASIGLQQTVLNGVGAAYPPLFGVLVAATSWRLGFVSVALLPLLGRRVLRALER